MNIARIQKLSCGISNLTASGGSGSSGACRTVYAVSGGSIG